jgi:putative DNA primase/helicase
VYLKFIQDCAAADAAEKTPNPRAKPKYESVLVLQGPQGVRKSDWLMSLVPPALSRYAKDGLHLTNDKDSRITVTSYWYPELAELDGTFRSADIAHIKAFLSEGTDDMRRPYGMTNNAYKRRTSMCATVNSIDFLRDETGSRRFLVIEASDVTPVSFTDIDLDQVWAEAWHYYIKGEQWWPTWEDEVLFRRAREQHEAINASVYMDRVIQTYGTFSTASQDKPRRMTLTAIAEEIGIENPSQTDVRMVGNVLRRLNKNGAGGPALVTHANRTRWMMPELTEGGSLTNPE